MHRVSGIGDGPPEWLPDMTGLAEVSAGAGVAKIVMDMPPGEVQETSADVAPLRTAVDQSPARPSRAGIDCFVKWMRGWHDRDTIYGAA